MKGIIVINKNFVPMGYDGITLFPFIFLKDESTRTDHVVRHENIHIAQQLEMLVIPFYVAYGLNFVINLIRRRKQPYRNICFEREAYLNEGHSGYLKSRGFWAWAKYIN